MKFISRNILFLTLQLVSQLQAKTTKDSETDHSSGYVAEWEIQEEEGKNVVLTSRRVSDIVNDIIPPQRLNDPATWLDSEGTWWLFGGQRPPVLEVNQSTTEFFGDLWAYGSETRKWSPIFRPVHDTPTPLSSYPENLQQLILCGSLAHGHLAVFGGLNHTGPNDGDPLFEEDNTVWLYDIPRQDPEITEDGLWTSYICCDACLPDQNTTLEFCPHFDQDGGNRPLVWCSLDSVMALNLNQNEEHLEHPLDWWKFDLGVTEWVKMGRLITAGSQVNLTTLFDPSCLTASAEELAYIFCPSQDLAKTKREVYLINSDENSVQRISTLTLNNAFGEDDLIWSTGGCVLAVVRLKNQSLLILAYRMLLDFWLHDHISGKLQALENIWKGPTLNYFQHTTGFYHLRIKFPTNETKTLFLLNPRERTMNFDPGLSRIFFVNIRTDKDVFLPGRDIPPNKSQNPVLLVGDPNLSKRDPLFSGINAEEHSPSNMSTLAITPTPDNFTPKRQDATISAAISATTNPPNVKPKALLGVPITIPNLKYSSEGISPPLENSGEIFSPTAKKVLPESLGFGPNVTAKEVAEKYPNNTAKLNSKKPQSIPGISVTVMKPSGAVKASPGEEFPTADTGVSDAARPHRSNVPGSFGPKLSLMPETEESGSTPRSTGTAKPNFLILNHGSTDPRISVTVHPNWPKDQKTWTDPEGSDREGLEKAKNNIWKRKPSFFPSQNPLGITRTSSSSFSSTSTSPTFTSRIPEDQNEASVVEERDKLNEDRSNSDWKKTTVVLEAELTKLKSNLNWTKATATSLSFLTEKDQRSGSGQLESKKVPILLYAPHQSEKETIGESSRIKDFLIVSGNKGKYENTRSSEAKIQRLSAQEKAKMAKNESFEITKKITTTLDPPRSKRGRRTIYS